MKRLLALIVIIPIVALAAVPNPPAIKPTAEELELIKYTRENCQDGCAVLSARDLQMLRTLLSRCGMQGAEFK